MFLYQSRRLICARIGRLFFLSGLEHKKISIGNTDTDRDEARAGNLPKFPAYAHGSEKGSAPIA